MSANSSDAARSYSIIAAQHLGDHRMCSEIHGTDARAMWEAREQEAKLPPPVEPGDVILYAIGEQTLANGCVVLLVRVRSVRMQSPEQEPQKEPVKEPASPEPAKDPAEPKPMEVYAIDAPSIVPRMRDMHWPRFFIPLRKESIVKLDLVA